MKLVNGWAFPSFDSHFKKHVGVFPETNYQQDIIDEAILHTKKFNVVIDAGANVGLHTIRFSNLFKEVYSFEPSSENFECLNKNCESFNNINLYNFGLGNREEEKTLRLPKDSSNCGLFSSVIYNKTNDSVLKKEIIKIITIDSLNLKVDLIKIDTQGTELEILQGSEITIKNCRPAIIVELEKKKIRSDVFNFLKKLNYTLIKQIGKDDIWIPL